MKVYIDVSEKGNYVTVLELDQGKKLYESKVIEPLLNEMIKNHQSIIAEHTAKIEKIQAKKRKAEKMQAVCDGLYSGEKVDTNKLTGKQFKVHYNKGMCGWTACGYETREVNYTTDKKRVTCKRCLTKMGSQLVC